MKILFLANRPSANSQAATVTEYLDSLHTHSQHEIFEISMMGHFPKNVDLNRFDAVILHYSLSMGPLINHYLGEELIKQIAEFPGLKAAFLQDEYRAIQTYWKHIKMLGMDILFSCVPEDEIPKVYPPAELPGLRVVNVLTGYVSEELNKIDAPKISERSLDVAYRSRKMPYWLGALGWEKIWICDEFTRRANGTGLTTDISVNEGDRFYGDAWTQFLLSSRAVLGTESGASIIDFDGLLEKRVDEYVAANPGVDFETVTDKFLAPYEGSLRLHQISPRCFETASLRTAMVLFEGEYSGILKPHRHYIPLKKDFSNFDEVVAKLKDHALLQEMVDRTYTEIALDPQWSYPAFINIIDTALQEGFAAKGRGEAPDGYTASSFAESLRKSWKFRLRRKTEMVLQRLILGTPRARKSLFNLWFMLPLPVQRFIRPWARIISR